MENYHLVIQKGLSKHLDQLHRTGEGLGKYPEGLVEVLEKGCSVLSSVNMINFAANK